MTDTKRHEIDDPLERAAKMGVIGGPVKQATQARSATQPKRQSAQTPKRQEVPTKPVIPEVDEVRKKQTVYLSASLLKWAKHQAVEEEMEISEVVEAALREYRKRIEGR